MKDNTDLHPAVQLLLKRMESHPQEFTASTPMRRMISRYEDYFTEAESAALRDALRGLMLDVMHKEVLHEMLAPEDKTRTDIDYAMAKQALGAYLQNGGTGISNLSTTEALLRSTYDAAHLTPPVRRSILSWGKGE
jgi:hypothetical protein